MSEGARFGSHSEEELMAAYQRGEPGAFEELFDRLSPVIYRMALRQVGRSELAEDIAQQTFLHFHRARLDFQAGRRVRPWIYTIAMNLIREHFRARARHRERELTLDGSQDPPVDPVDLAEAEAGIARRRALRTALRTLNTQQREVIELHWFQGLSFPEVAEIVGASTSAVKVRAHRGYKKLRAALGTWDETEEGNR